jgi:S1-C subfamily serine protease
MINRSSSVGFVAAEMLSDIRMDEREMQIQKTMHDRVAGGDFSTYACGIITCNHLFDERGEIVVEFPGSRRSYFAVVQASDKQRDLAFLRVRYIEKAPMPGLKFADAEPDVGADVFIVELPENGMARITAGKTLEPDVEYNTFYNVNYQMLTCHPTLANSGGPLLDNRTRVVGAITGYHTDKVSADVAISSEDLRTFLAAATKPTHMHD